MNTGKTIFAQVMDHLDLPYFRKCVKRYNGNYRARSLTCLDQFLCMAFAQLTYRQSLRDAVTCLQAMPSKLYHMGIRGNISRSTLADANEKRNWRIYADFAQHLIQIARNLYAKDDFGLDLDQTVYAFDATIIHLCLSLFPWSHFRLQQGAIKLHTLMDVRGAIPSCVWVTPAKVQEVSMLDHLTPEPGSFYLFDRGYFDFSRLYTLHRALAFFVIRSKKRISFRRLYSQTVDKSTGLRSDQTVVPTVDKALKDYPEKLRRIRFLDTEEQRYFTFMTNNFTVDAITIAHLYKCRWQVELFFKWIKQHLRIQNFFGTSQNAVLTQIWIALSVYVLIAIIKKRLDLEISLYKILQILSVTIFEKMPISRAFSPTEQQNLIARCPNQLLLLDF